MSQRRPLRFVLFTLDAFRLAAMLGVLAQIRAASPNGALAAAAAVACAAPQALFVLMALFFSLAPDRFAVYPPLYAAGKAVSACALAGLAVANWGAAFVAFRSAEANDLPLLLTFVAIGLYDALSAAAAATLLRSGADSRMTPDMANRPDFSVDVLPEDPAGSDRTAPSTGGR